jgi:hypothetical protein
MPLQPGPAGARGFGAVIGAEWRLLLYPPAELDIPTMTNDTTTPKATTPTDATALARPRSRTMVRRKRDESVRRLIGKLRREASYLSEPRYAPLLKSYCELTVLISRGYARVREGDLTSATTGELRASLDTLLRMYATQGRLARELGLTPTVAATMAKTVSMLDLESLRDAETVDE